MYCLILNQDVLMFNKLVCMSMKGILNLASLSNLFSVQYLLNSYYVALCDVLISVLNASKAQA